MQGEGQGYTAFLGKKRQPEHWDRSPRRDLLGCIIKLHPPSLMKLFSANNFLCLLIIDINFRLLALMRLCLGLLV